MRDVTLVYLIKESKEKKITDMLWAMKKRGFGEGLWNGVGGKVEEDESIEEAARREAFEEIRVKLGKMEKVAELEFRFPPKPEWDQLGHVYFVRSWEGEPTETEEMRPKWFKVNELPYNEMWSADSKWVPEVIKGRKIVSKIVFGLGNEVEKFGFVKIPGF